MPINPDDIELLIGQTPVVAKNATTPTTQPLGIHAPMPSGAKILTALEGWAPGAHQMHACSIARGMARYGVPRHVTACLIGTLARLDGAKEPDALIRAAGEMYDEHEKEVPPTPVYTHSAELDIPAIVSERSFLHKYMEYCREAGGTHPTNDFFCGLAAVAGAVGNTVKIKAWNQLFSPNLWILLVGPSSANYKSSSIGHAGDILHRATKRDVVKHFDRHGAELASPEGEKGERQRTLTRSNRFPKEATMEALVGYMKDVPGGLIAHGEWKAYFTSLDKSYMVGSKQTLTDLYDGGYVHRVLKGSETYLEGVAISILSATTPEWLEQAIQPEDFEGGFYSRFLFVPVNGAWKPSGISNTDGWQEREALASQLKQFSVYAGYELDAKTLSGDYTALQTRFHAQAVASQREEIIEPLSKRLAVSVLKMALLLEIAENGRPILTKESFAKAALVGDWVLAATIALVSGRIATTGSPIEKQCQKVMRFLEDGAKTRVQVSAHLRGLSSYEITRIKETLEGQNWIRVVKHTSSKGRPTEMWTKTNGGSNVE